MISFLAGTYVEMEEDGAVVVNVGGVGYRAIVSDRDRRIVNDRGVGGEVFLFCRTIASEFATIVYGFLAQNDRRAFDRILKVDGCGPATAMRILSQHSARDFLGIVDAKDAAALTKIPGVGKKTADKILTSVKPFGLVGEQ